MCILFLYVDEFAEKGSYKVILAANRDEYFDRPTEIAHFWPNQPDTVGGRDLEKGKEGGTWLAMGKTGKIGALLNIMTSSFSQEKSGRGFLINDYLNSDSDSTEYCSELSKIANDFNPFNLVLLDIKKGKEMCLCYYSNGSSKGPVLLPLSKKFFSFGNSLLEKPFKKVMSGEEKLRELLANSSKIKDKEHLIGKLLSILKSPEKHYPDNQMKEQVPNFSAPFLKNLSANFVQIPVRKYGSRTHTIILIDHDDNVEYHEWTMKEPIKKSPEWIHSEFQFQLDPL